MKTWIKRYPIAAYFVLVFGVEWLLVFALSTLLPSMIILLIGSWLPNIVGVFVTGVVRGRIGIQELFSKIVLWQIGIKWYLTAVLLPAALVFLSIVLYNLFGYKSPGFAPFNQIPQIVLLALFTGAMGEELGWRGTALPRMQAHWNALITSLILGILWGFYHLPSFLISGLPLRDAPLIPFMLGAVGLTFLVTWTFNRTRGSLILVFLYHFSFNLLLNVSGMPNDSSLFWMFGGIVIIAAGVIVIADWRHFTRDMILSTEDTWVIQNS